MKSKFKVMDILRLIEKQHNMTKGGLYCANQVFELDSDIPIIETVDDYGLVVSLYETSFEATDVALDVDTQHKMSADDAKSFVRGCVRQFFCMCEEDDSEGLMTKIQHDKELQKALLVLMQTASCLGEGK